MIDLNNLRVFVQVIEHGGFTAASRALALPKQTLSKKVADLERQAGTRLIHRTSRRFVVTELGQELYRHAAAMVVEAQAADDVLHGRLSEPSGTVRITASFPLVQAWLAPLLPGLAKAHPKIRLVLHASDRMVDIVKEGYDLALRSHALPLPDSELVRRHVHSEPMWLVAAPSYRPTPWPDHPALLTGVEAISSGRESNAWSLQGPGGETQSVSLTARYIANEGAAILAAATAGLGIACLPVSMCSAALAGGSLIRICPEWTAGAITTTLLMPHRRAILPSVRVVADHIVDALAP
jgi:DNA-binding transcriptional LysR family regulator